MRRPPSSYVRAHRTSVQTEALQSYLEPAPLVDRDSDSIAAFVDTKLAGVDRTAAVRAVFHFVRDEVAHSWDIQGRRVTRSASDVLAYREGICYAKSHLVAALLRRFGIPTALCYQRLTLSNDDREGYAVHALNAVYLEGRWHRIDARGNKPGVHAECSLVDERLAFPVRVEYDECDYPALFAAPHPAIVACLESSHDAIAMYRRRLPSNL